MLAQAKRSMKGWSLAKIPDNDLVVNVVRRKQLTNVRASGSDENIILTPPLTFTLEQAIDFIQDDELVEVTPNFIRLRKRTPQRK